MCRFHSGQTTQHNEQTQYDANVGTDAVWLPSAEASSDCGVRSCSQKHTACCQGTGDCMMALSKHWGLHQGTGDCIKALSEHWGRHQGTVKALGTASGHCQTTGDCIRARESLLACMQPTNVLHHKKQAEAVGHHQHIRSRGHNALGVVNDKAQPLGCRPTPKKSTYLFGHQCFTP